MGEIAYAVKSSYVDDGFEAGDVAIGDDTYHLGEELRKGNGYVVVESDSLTAIRLDDHVALERVDVHAAHKASAKRPKVEDAKAAATSTKPAEGA